MYQQILGICSTNEKKALHQVTGRPKKIKFVGSPEDDLKSVLFTMFSGSFALIHTQNSRRQMFFFCSLLENPRGKHVTMFTTLTRVVPHHSMTKGNWPWHAWRDWVFSPAAYWPGLSSSTTCLGTRRSYWKLKTAAFWRCKMSVFGYGSKLYPGKKKWMLSDHLGFEEALEQILSHSPWRIKVADWTPAGMP